MALEGSACEGIILVFDMADGDSFTFLERWQPFLEEHDVEVQARLAVPVDVSRRCRPAALRAARAARALA